MIDFNKKYIKKRDQTILPTFKNKFRSKHFLSDFQEVIDAAIITTISVITRTRKAREIKLTYTTSLPEILIKYTFSTGTRKAREKRIINDTLLSETSIKYASSIENADCNLSISDESNNELLVDN